MEAIIIIIIVIKTLLWESWDINSNLKSATS